ncbi:hypothetical protein C6V04_04935 [Burkholderia multivorans]|nr:hypothetical protein C6V04_04935 [Burkholderia multivorans]
MGARRRCRACPDRRPPPDDHRGDRLMSFHLTNLAWDVELRSNQKIVLLALAHLATQSTGVCAASVRKLAFMCGLSDSGVRDQLKQLVEAGRVEVIDSDDGPRYRISVGPRT